MKLTRYAGNPILSPEPSHPWEDLAVFNPAAWYDPDKKEVLLLYRAAESHPEYKCYFGLAASKDGYHFDRVSDEPVFRPSGDGFDGATVQDPRMVKFGEYYYITYACRHYPFGQFWVPKEKQLHRAAECPSDFPRYLRINATLTGLLLTKDFKTFIRAGSLTDPLLDDRDVILFPEKVGGKYVLLHRPLEWVGPEYGTEYASAWISTAEDLFGFRESRLLVKKKYDWESGKLGINTPPIKTRHGWLTLYHAVGADKFYRLGAILLDLDDPSRVLHRTPRWIFEPEAPYEIEGYYRGCVFPCGKVVIGRTLFVYYGAADKYVGVATCDLEELLDHLLGCPA
jgi:beta-1,2-mannobiose phosphorylase / 1,2-beta-oligomannan phosphorylase